MATKQQYHRSEEVFNRERSWRFRVALAAFPADPMGMVTRAVLGINSRTGPAFGLEATIRRDGLIVAPLRGRDGQYLTRAHPIGTVIAVRDEFRRLADHCQLPDDERIALFDEVKKWCGKDLRAKSN